MVKKRITGIFLIVFMVTSVVMAAVFISQVIKNTENPTWDGLLRGHWAPGFEKTLNDTLPVSDMARDFWGATEFSIFGEGRKGVIVGQNGWLFTDEEFECPKNVHEHVEKNLSFIKSTRDQLQSKSIQLVIALVPAKVRLYSEYLGAHVVPACRYAIYARTMAFLQKEGIVGVDLLTPMSEASDKEKFFLKTDTHWTPEGAQFAAKQISGFVDRAQLTSKHFDTSAGDGVHEHKGDLMRYLPGVPEVVVAPDHMKSYETAEVTGEDSAGAEDSALALFGDDVPPVTLVGTSYSANPLWHFLGFLKDSLDADILDASDEGQGPFTVMTRYLEGTALQNTPPQLVVWEIPERYMTSDPSPQKKSAGH